LFADYFHITFFPDLKNTTAADNKMIFGFKKLFTEPKFIVNPVNA